MPALRKTLPSGSGTRSNDCPFSYTCVTFPLLSKSTRLNVPKRVTYALATIGAEGVLLDEV